MLKQGLHQKLLQKLSPQQIQLIKLLEVPTIQLEQRIKREIEENPVLEEGNEDELEFSTYEKNDSDSEDYSSFDESAEKNKDSEYELINYENTKTEAPKEKETKNTEDEFSLEDYMPDDELYNYKLSVNNHSKDDKKNEIPYSTGMSFHEHLESQLGLRILSESQQQLALYIIGNIDQDGYLRREIDAIVDDLAFGQNIMTDEVELLGILDIIHDFDPSGVGARDLQECLLLQLNRKITLTPETEALSLAHNMLKEYFIEFTKKHYEKIIQKLSISETQLKDAITEILKLSPKPGSIFSGSLTRSSQHITPDFTLEEIDGELILGLNSKNVPELRVNRMYANMIEAYQGNKKGHSKQEKEAITFVKQKLDSAKWFIDAIRQRQNTLMLTMNSIINYQREYFIEGDETRLRPMILKDIAEKTNLDISTISRVANSKYIQTHFGIFPLKYFFSEGMQTDSGEEVSTREIKKILRECIDTENKRKPLTDEKLAKILQEKGYQIARRTVAKYREQLGILVARLRKEL